MQNSNKKGFTLLELLIVIGIIAILSVVVILVLNPAETLRKSRDTQRMSDLATLKTAIGLYTTTIATPTLSSTTDTGTNPRVNFSNTACQAAMGTWTVGEDRIFYSIPSDTTEITDSTLDNVTFSATFGATQVTDAYNSLTNGTGWLPIKFSDIIGGSPISNLPADPTNTVADGAEVQSTDLVYRYGCANVGSILHYEINATLESAEFTTVPNNRRIKDGGNSTLMYEVGTNPAILGANHATTTTLGF